MLFADQALAKQVVLLIIIFAFLRVTQKNKQLIFSLTVLFSKRSDT